MFNEPNIILQSFTIRAHLRSDIVMSHTGKLMMQQQIGTWQTSALTYELMP